MVFYSFASKAFIYETIPIVSIKHSTLINLDWVDRNHRSEVWSLGPACSGTSTLAAAFTVSRLAPVGTLWQRVFFFLLRRLRFTLHLTSTSA